MKGLGQPENLKVTIIITVKDSENRPNADNNIELRTVPEDFSVQSVARLLP